jgi:hypothetical protein
MWPTAVYVFCIFKKLAAMTLVTTTSFKDAAVYTPLVPFRPRTIDITNRIRKRNRRIFAIHAASPAMPPNPKMAATIATIKKITAQRNMMAFHPVKPEKMLPENLDIVAIRMKVGTQLPMS